MSLASFSSTASSTGSGCAPMFRSARTSCAHSTMLAVRMPFAPNSSISFARWPGVAPSFRVAACKARPAIVAAASQLFVPMAFFACSHDRLTCSGQ
jgi:hypothetical protein